MIISIRKAVTENWTWVIAGKVITLGTGFATNVILARLLPPQELGVYFLLFSFVNLGVLISLLGMERTIVRMVSQLLARDKPIQAYTLIRKVLLIGTGASIIIALLLAGGPGRFISERLFKSQLMSSLIGLAVLWIILFTVQRLAAESFRGLHNIKLATIFNGLFGNGLIALTLAALLILQASLSIADILIVVLVCYLINVVFSLRSLLRTPGSSSNGPDAVTPLRSVILETRYLYALSLMIFVLDNGHLWLLGSISDKESVAVLGAIERLMILITTGLFAMRLSIAPIVSHLYTLNRHKELESLLRTVATLIGIPTLAAFAVLPFVGKQILTLTFGAAYATGYNALIILAAANVINVLTGLPGVLMIMASRERPLLSITAISGAAALIISFLLIPPLGFLGAAIGSATGIMLHNCATAYYCYRTLHIRTYFGLPARTTVADILHSNLRRKRSGEPLVSES